MTASSDSSENIEPQDAPETAPSGFAIGIDLGTTNSCAAIIRGDEDDESPEILPNAEGNRTTPSVVAKIGVGPSQQTLVGKPAVDQEANNPEGTRRSVKRLMGTSERVWLGSESLSPEEISAEILKKVKRDCEQLLGGPVTDAVITIPAYFSNDQREATMMAGKLAGLNVLRIINEPTAAAFAYGLNKKKDEKVMVYDLGGGTFDVTLLSISSIGVFEVLATNGDTQLGGDDFDHELVRILTERILAANPQIGKFTSAMNARLREAAEAAKKQLSAGQSAAVSLPFFTFIPPKVEIVDGAAQITDHGGPINFDTTITRSEFEDSIRPFVDQTIRCVENAMRDARLEYRDIDEVVFVGGSTRVPLVAETIEKLTGKKPNRSVNPDEAVAAGAAVQAAILSGARKKDILLLDITPLTYGIETFGGDMNPMIERNTTIPFEYTEEFSTAEDGQTKVDIRVYQGERPRAADNLFLGEFHLTGLVPAPRGVPKINVTFDVNANGILSVTAVDKVTGKEQTVTMTGKSGLTAADVRRILQDAEANADADLLYRQQSELRQTMHGQTLQVETLLKESRSALSEETIEDLTMTLDALKDAAKNLIESTEIMEGIVAGAQESILAAGKEVYAKAEEMAKAAQAGNA